MENKYNGLILMLKDIPVMHINIDYGIYDILNMNLLPYQIRGVVENKVLNSENFMEQRLYERRCEGAFISFLAGRTLPLDRLNAKKVLNLLNASQAQDPYTRAKVALICRAVTLQDNYWVKLENEEVTWKDVDLRQNRLSSIVAQVALHGKSLTLQGKFHTPELTTHGAYAKAWKRDDGKLYLYKRSFRDGMESQIEVEVSNLLDKCNVNHLKYEKASSEGYFCCKCECMSTQKISMLSASDFNAYCSRLGLNPTNEALKVDKDSIYKMLIVDYLICNPDRHDENWGFLYECDTMKLLRCYPLYDHNNAFDEGNMKNITGGNSHFYTNRTMVDAAKFALKRTDFKFTSPIKKSDFLTGKHYKAFKERAKVLGLTIN